MNVCPICKKEVHNEIGNTQLCTECHKKRFFEDDLKEAMYVLEVNRRIEKLKAEYGEDYKAEFHEDMVQQMVRCEIQMRYYERLIANNRETPTTIELLSRERNHWRNLADKLHVTLRSIRGDTKTLKHEMGKDFKDYLTAMLNALEGKSEVSEEDEE